MSEDRPGAGVSAEFAIAMSTFPNEETAKKIARELVDGGLVACANIVPAIISIYFWKDKVEESGGARDLQTNDGALR